LKTTVQTGTKQTKQNHTKYMNKKQATYKSSSTGQVATTHICSIYSKIATPVLVFTVVWGMKHFYLVKLSSLKAEEGCHRWLTGNP